MQNVTYKEDNGLKFGKWNDKISKFMYFDCMKDILSNIKIPLKIADYSGANGNLKTFMPQSISIDIDISKNPDICDNILTHFGNYDLIVIRYVLHYLNDYEVLQLFKHIKTFHKGNVLIIQFCNNDLKSKYENSKNEFKYFRTQNQLKKLLPECEVLYSKKYKIGKSFYKNRLNIDGAISHEEILNAYWI